MNEELVLNEDDINYVRTLSESAYDLKSRMNIFANQLRERREKIEETVTDDDIDTVIDLMDETSEMVEEAYEQLDSYLEEYD